MNPNHSKKTGQFISSNSALTGVAGMTSISGSHIRKKLQQSTAVDMRAPGYTEVHAKTGRIGSIQGNQKLGYSAHVAGYTGPKSSSKKGAIRAAIKDLGKKK